MNEITGTELRLDTSPPCIQLAEVIARLDADKVPSSQRIERKQGDVTILR